jgi:hypothetical protein
MDTGLEIIEDMLKLYKDFSEKKMKASLILQIQYIVMKLPTLKSDCLLSNYE